MLHTCILSVKCYWTLVGNSAIQINTLIIIIIIIIIIIMMMCCKDVEMHVLSVLICSLPSNSVNIYFIMVIFLVRLVILV